MKKYITKLVVLGASILPFVALAQGTALYSSIDVFLTNLRKIITALVPIVFALGVLAFFWGLVLYIFSQGSEEKKKEGKGVMLWALVALFVMSSVWGIIALAQSTLGIQNTQPIVPNVNLPKVNF